jgi:hypothetical protein
MLEGEKYRQISPSPWAVELVLDHGFFFPAVALLLLLFLFPPALASFLFSFRKTSLSQVTRIARVQWKPRKKII